MKLKPTLSDLFHIITNVLLFIDYHKLPNLWAEKYEIFGIDLKLNFGLLKIAEILIGSEKILAAKFKKI